MILGTADLLQCGEEVGMVLGAWPSPSSELDVKNHLATSPSSSLDGVPRHPASWTTSTTELDVDHETT